MNEEAKVIRAAENGKVIVDTGGGVQFEADLFLPPGESSAPLPGDTVVIAEVQGTGRRVAIGSYDPSVDSASSGEKELYSRNSSGSKAASIKLLSNGDIELNGNSKTFVTGAELQTILSAFTTQLNLAFAAKLDGGGTSPALSIDISSAQTTTVKTGG